MSQGEHSIEIVDQKRSRASYISFVSALAIIPRTFQASLFPRSTLDQGIVTGVSVAMVYGMSVLLQDIGEAAAHAIFENSTQRLQSDQRMSPVGALLVAAAVYGVSHVIQSKSSYNPDEELRRSAVRTTSYWAQNLALAAAVVSVVELVGDAVDKKSNRQTAHQRNLLPWVIGAGIALTAGSEYVRNSKQKIGKSIPLDQPNPGRALLIGSGFVGLLAAVVTAERYFARKIDHILHSNARLPKRDWLPVGHLTVIGASGVALYSYIQRVFNRIESSANRFEKGFDAQPSSRYVSGSAVSLVPWSSLSAEGRRHIKTRLAGNIIADVMEEPAVAEPIRIFVGLDSAPNEQARVALALQELERTGAYNRSVLVIVSPTGSGYVNYVMSESVEYMSRGDCASVTLQYSKRPSPLSLNRLGGGHAQFRLLLNGIKRRLADIPMSQRPRILLFGESLGAWTSQDAFMHGGTDGLEALGIDRALWIGTPKGSKWREQILAEKQLNIESGLTGEFASCSELDDLSPQDRDKLRYVMITQHNDPIAHFGFDLLIKQPPWVDGKVGATSNRYSGVRYRSTILFVQTLLDMKNALKPVPGDFVADGHDYRAQLAGCVRQIFGFTVSAKQMERIESALRDNEIERQNRIEQASKKLT